jgi:transcriptional regulator with XRE-family HTH domain
MSNITIGTNKFHWSYPNSGFSLGYKIRLYRRRAGLSQLNLEVLAGLSPGVISRMENDLINPTKETLVRVIKVLNLSNEEIVDLFGC